MPQAGARHAAKRGGRLGINPEVLDTARCEGPPIAELGDDDNPVAVEKDRSSSPYHVVALVCRSGCETRQCQTTA